MSHIQKLIEELRRRSDVGIVEQGESWLITMTKGRDLYCEITVPQGVLEWFACVKHRQENKELWSDWMDYSGYDDTARQKLEAAMADDILAFVDRVSRSEWVLPLQMYEDRI